jgi:hypothetical protein
MDPWLPEMHHGVPGIGIEGLFRFREQLLAKSFVHDRFYPAACPANRQDCSHLTPGKSSLLRRG